MSSTTHSVGPNVTGGKTRIVLIGAGTIGLSFAALHLRSPVDLTICDIRPDLGDYVHANLPRYLDDLDRHLVNEVRLTNDLKEAIKDADIVQEQGPENLAFKQQIWREVEESAPEHALLWSSTSGIPASEQQAEMRDKSRLLVVHPYNPPHIMPLLEVVPAPTTSQDVLDKTLAFWRRLGREPVVIKKECTGFVANRLAFALLREAIHLVDDGVVTVEELDTIVTSSMGPRWAVWGPFKSYHAGGGLAGLEGFFNNIGGTVQACWDDSGRDNVGDGWETNVFKQSSESYGTVNTDVRDTTTMRVLDITRR